MRSSSITNTLVRLCRQLVLAWVVATFAAPACAAKGTAAILVYHRFGPSGGDSMTWQRYLIVDASGVGGLIRLLRDGERRAGATQP